MKPKKATKPKTKTAKTAAKAAKPAKVVKPAAKIEKVPAAKPVAKAKPKAAESDSKVLALVEKFLNQEKVEDIVSIDLRGKTTIADHMFIATGSSSRSVAASASKLRDALAKEGYRAKVEGANTGDWVIVDARDVVVHLFRAEVRSFYNLEKLWSTDFSTVGYNLYSST